jgi:hypothetical protein
MVGTASIAMSCEIASKLRNLLLIFILLESLFNQNETQILFFFKTLWLISFP